ncbi:unnamed protein product [Brugia timori]|uniref:Secreted protein n=1 Tax=Brugia timori TaxID=42155 RepID=A0A0R3R5L1_9BILA|nr:unnamed protein product [Brugia timori]
MTMLMMMVMTMMMMMMRNGTLKLRQISSNILIDGGMNWTRIINVKHWADAIVRI